MIVTPPTGTDPIRPRIALARHTARAHEALHDHAWISRLLHPALTAPEYRVILSAYAAFFAAVERERASAGLLAPFTLDACLAALTRDLGTDVRPARIGPQTDRSRPALLGALYVLHGAGFGGSTLRAQVARALPELPHHYLSRAPSPTLWRRLVAEIDETEPEPRDRDVLFASARKTFEAFGETVSKICAAHLPAAAPHASPSRGGASGRA